MSADGSRIATASEKGTIVRVFDSVEGTQLFELRRGADHAVVYSLSFSQACDWLATTSDKGTVHVFSLTAKPQGAAGAGAGPSARGAAPGEAQRSDDSPGTAGAAAGEVERPASVGSARPQSGKGAAKLAQSSVKFVVRARARSLKVSRPPVRPDHHRPRELIQAPHDAPAARLPAQGPSHLLLQHVVSRPVPASRGDAVVKCGAWKSWLTLGQEATASQRLAHAESAARPRLIPRRRSARATRSRWQRSAARSTAAASTPRCPGRQRSCPSRGS